MWISGREAPCHEFDEALKRARSTTRQYAALMAAFTFISVVTVSNASGSTGADLDIAANQAPGLSDLLGPRVEDDVVVLIPPWREEVRDLIPVVDVGPDPAPRQEPRSVAGGTRPVDGRIPHVAFSAYLKAESDIAVDQPSCGIEWALIAAIGRVESNHGQYGGARLRPDGTTTRAIRGIPLDGRPGVAQIADTDRGVLDGDTKFDRAVGPMQFIPSTWRAVMPTGNPDNIFDAALAAGRYLCAGGGNLRIEEERAPAVFRYNHSREYVTLVLRLAEYYRSGSIGLVEQTPPAGAPDVGSVRALPPPAPGQPDAAGAKNDAPPRYSTTTTTGTKPTAAPGTTAAATAPPMPTSCAPADADASTCDPEPRPSTAPTEPTVPPSTPPHTREPSLICTVLGIVVDCSEDIGTP